MIIPVMYVKVVYMKRFLTLLLINMKIGVLLFMIWQHNILNGHLEQLKFLFQFLMKDQKMETL